MDSIILFQEIKSKSLTFDEIVPKWANKINAVWQTGFPFPLSLRWWSWYFSLDSPAKCIIGEAHGYSSHYENECNICDSIGWEFGHFFLMRSRKDFMANVEKFVAHWNEKHISQEKVRSIDNT
jgi:hypothetical protein